MLVGLIVIIILLIALIVGFSGRFRLLWLWHGLWGSWDHQCHFDCRLGPAVHGMHLKRLDLLFGTCLLNEEGLRNERSAP
jgi:hypothetical protein